MDNVVIGLVIPNALERETQISLLGQTIKCSHIREDSRTLMMVERIVQFGVFLNPSLRELSVCTNFVPKLQYFLVDAHIPVLLLSLAPSLAPFFLHSQLFLKRFVVL